MTIPGEILDEIRQIKPLSSSTIQLIDVVADPEHDSRDVMRIVETDSVLTGALLKTINSAAFGLANSITSVEKAISYLGDKMVLGISLGLCASDVFDAPLPGYESPQGDLWRHSLQVGMACRELAAYAHPAVCPSEAYTCGLLHDIGKVAVAMALRDRGPEMVETVDRGEAADYLEAERRKIGFDHCETGMVLADHWRLPSPLSEAIACHHRPAEGPQMYRALLYVVHLGDFMAQMTGAGTGTDDLQYMLDPEYKDYVDLSCGELDGVMLRVTQEYRRMIEATANISEAA